MPPRAGIVCAGKALHAGGRVRPCGFDVMVQELLSLVPADQVRTTLLAVVLTGSMLGAATLLLGGLRSRFMMCLLLLVGGTLAGHSVPEWFGLRIEPNATAILGAIVMGILGFAFHRVWVAIGLGMMLGGLAGVILWFKLDAGRLFHAPAAEQGMTVASYVLLCWDQAPPIFKAKLPVVGAAAGLAGLVVGMLLNRVGTAFFYSILGTSILFLSLLFGEASGQMPTASYLLPEVSEMRVVLFAGFVLLGTMVHLATMPRPLPAGGRAEPKPEDDS